MRFKKPLSMWLAVASMLTLLAISASILMAQSAGTSGLAGTVTDPSGAADSQRHRNYHQQRNRPNAHGNYGRRWFLQVQPVAAGHVSRPFRRYRF